jgi:AAA15 family ATPase/GTPase
MSKELVTIQVTSPRESEKSIGVLVDLVFNEKGAEFEIAPITILTGCNSSGKSSVIKSLMLIQEMFKSMKTDYVKR